jgi:phage shock protein A
MTTRLDLATTPSAPAMAGTYGRPQIRSQSARLFSRMRDILAANLSEMLDHSGEPEQMIRMIIIEMEETLVHVRASTARTIADLKELQAARGALQNMAENWHEKAELAISRDRDDLARQALVEKNKADERIAEIGIEIATLDKALGANHNDIARLQAKLGEACTRRSNIRARLESAESSIRLRELLNGGAVKDAFSRFEDLEKQVDSAEGHAEAAAIGYDNDEDIMRDRQLNAKVDAELAAMKKTTAR